MPYPIAWIAAASVGAAAAGGTWWELSSFRIERTSDRLVCGIERDMVGLTGEPLGSAKTEASACRVLFDKPKTECPIIAASALRLCQKKENAPAEGWPNRALITSIARAPEVLETGAWARTAWYAYLGARRVATTFAIGGEGCPAIAEQGYAIEGAGRCLAVGIDSQTIVTAAHCLPASRVVSMECFGQIVDATCESPAPKGLDWEVVCVGTNPPEGCFADIARCNPSPPGICTVSTHEKPAWAKPQPVPTTVQVMSRGPFECLKLDDAEVSSPWPVATQAAFLEAAMDDVDLQKGDSGGPVFDRADSQRRVIGISVRTGATAKIAPIYRWFPDGTQ